MKDDNITLYKKNYFNCNISEWSSQDVVEKYLKPINMGHLEKTFVENNISGAVLIALEVI